MEQIKERLTKKWFDNMSICLNLPINLCLMLNQKLTDSPWWMSKGMLWLNNKLKCQVHLLRKYRKYQKCFSSMSLCCHTKTANSSSCGTGAQAQPQRLHAEATVKSSVQLDIDQSQSHSFSLILHTYNIYKSTFPNSIKTLLNRTSIHPSDFICF